MHASRPFRGSAERRTPPSVATSARHLAYETRELLSGGTFLPPPAEISPANPVQLVRVAALNFSPTIPSRDNRPLWEVFGWNDPRELAAGYIDDIESASGGAVDYEIVAWRDLNEFPIFTDGFRYTADQYVANRQSNSGWHEGVADFYAIARQQHLADLVNTQEIDEIWLFGDHYFALLGEAWMAGPQSFFINGPSFPDFAVDRAVAGFGFNYERGVAEMVHNLGHRAENHFSRAYGGWNIAQPTSAWDYFTANAAQSNTATYGVGSVHYPFNGASDYDYANPRTFASYADSFVRDFPEPDYSGAPTDRTAWGDYGVGDWQRGYLNWFFGHVPRGDGVAPDGRANNWYKYLFDFNAYRPGSGLPRNDEAILGTAPLTTGGQPDYEFTLRFYETTEIDAATLDDADVLITGPNGFAQMAELVDAGLARPTTAGSARTVRYRITAPGGTWDAADSGAYQASLQAGQVRDVVGNWLPAAALGAFRVDIADVGRIDVAALLAGGVASVDATPWDIGGPAALFDGSSVSLYRTPNIDPAVITLSFDAPQTLNGFRTLASHAWGDPAYRWRVESADSLADLASQSGSYRELAPWQGTPSDVFSIITLPSPVAAQHVRLTVERLTGDDYVHVNAWELLTTPVIDAAPPAAELLPSSAAPATPHVHQFSIRYTDDVAIDGSSINFGDVIVTGPHGFRQTAALAAVDASGGAATQTVDYFVSAPGGGWDFTDNGVYSISLAADEVLDARGKAVASGSLGQFTIELPAPETRPLSDMTELNAASWVAWAAGSWATVADDAQRKVQGAASLRFDTGGGFDTYVRYAPAAGAAWNLTGASEFRFQIYAENPSPFGFQQEPIVRLIDGDGAVREYRYFNAAGQPTPLWNSARNRWLAVAMPLHVDANGVAGWRTVEPGSIDWTRVASVEIHADTWDAGFTLWLDAMGFDLPLSGDYDRSGVVDEADANLWAAAFPSWTDLAADGTGDGVVDGADLLLWQRHAGDFDAGAFDAGDFDAGGATAASASAPAAAPQSFAAAVAALEGGAWYDAITPEYRERSRRGRR